MQFESHITVPQRLDEVAAFFNDPFNLLRWDKSVARIIPKSPGNIREGYAFDTIAPSGLRMSYKIEEVDPQRGGHIRLLNSPIFKDALWSMLYETVEQGTKVICRIKFKLYARYFWLHMPLLIFNRSALARDLSQLAAALEQTFPIHAAASN
jgi:hypothetical protein